MTHYPFDPRRAEEYLSEAGYRKGGDGVQVNAAGERLSMEVWADAGPQYEKEQAVLADVWRGIGVEARTSFVPPARLRDNQFRSSFPALHTTSAGRLESLATSGIPTPQNHWSGSNRGSWANPEYDRLFDAFNTTLEPDRRVDQVVQMLKLASEELPSWVLYYNQSVSAYAASVKGPDNSGLNTDTWNVYTWEVSQ
jgi:peptide/nickel transport system substrate-binding protein